MKICKMVDGKLVTKNCCQEDYKAYYAQGWKLCKEEPVKETKAEKALAEDSEDEVYSRYKKGR